MELPQLRKELEKQKNRTGLVGVRLDVSEVPGNSLSAHITTDWKYISIKYGAELDLIPDDKTKKYAKNRGIENPALKVGQDILDHEMGHREKPAGTRLGCPYTVEMHDTIKESINKALSQKGKPGLEDYVTNAFEDLLDNINCRKGTDFSGQTLFWNNQGLVNSENGKYSKFYEAFIKINLMLGGAVQEYGLLERFYTNDAKISGAVKSFLNDMKSRLGAEYLTKFHEKPEFKELFNYNLEEREELWAALAYSFADNLADLIDKMPKEEMFGSGGENPFDKEMKLPKNKQEIAYKRYKEGKGAATHRDFHEQLYDLYKKISKDIRIETSSYTDSQGMPLIDYGRRFIKEDERKFKYKGVGFDNDGELNIKTSKHQILFPVSYKVHPRNFPKFKLELMDRSGSMAQSPNGDSNIGSTAFIPWGDNSKYHYALKGYFGIDNFFERQGIIGYIESAAIGFSGESGVRGNSKDVAKSLLSAPSGGTSLDIDGLEKELQQDSLVLSISDGELSISDDEKARFEDKIKQKGVNYAHIQIGNNSAFSEYLTSIGVPVFPVKGDNDLAKTMITFVSGCYRAHKGGKQ